MKTIILSFFSICMSLPAFADSTKCTVREYKTINSYTFSSKIVNTVTIHTSANTASLLYSDEASGLQVYGKGWANEDNKTVRDKFTLTAYEISNLKVTELVSVSGSFDRPLKLSVRPRNFEINCKQP